MTNSSLAEKQYKYIFFDLDHTLWDYETNSQITLQELYTQYSLHAKGISAFEDFHKRFREVNEELWYFYDRGLIDSDTIRKERFKKILETFQAHEENLCENLSHDYLHTCPLKGHLMPHALETLAYLQGRYEMTIITNGFEEIQHLKLESGKLRPFFSHVVTSQKAGYKKPSREIFEFALTAHGATANEAIMIGDNLITDIGGARNASIDAVYYNPLKITHDQSVYREISTLAELRQIL